MTTTELRVMLTASGFTRIDNNGYRLRTEYAGDVLVWIIPGPGKSVAFPVGIYDHVADDGVAADDAREFQCHSDPAAAWDHADTLVQKTATIG